MTDSLARATDDGGSIQPARFGVSAARDLLARTAELPGSKRELLAVLNEYRAAVFAFAAQRDRA
jgi:hypothetical protein